MPTKTIPARKKHLRINSTEAEKKLWYALRNRQLENAKFIRQFAVGPYIADFTCREKALIIEVDGGQHGESLTDEKRTSYLNAEGYSVLRFWNNEVLDNLEGVLYAVQTVLRGHPSPDLRFAAATLSPEGRGEKGIAAATAKQRKAPVSSPLKGEGSPKDRMRGEPTTSTRPIGRPT